METNCLLSIIIPVYRVERTLDECVRSVLVSCGADAQVILVDDGSPDGCPALCDEWAARDGRIEVIHRANGGLSTARNSGLDAARGRWVTFVDSDDVVCAGTVYGLCGADEGVDIIEYPVRRHHATSDETLLQWGDSTFTSAKDYWLSTGGWTHCYAWNKVYRRKLFDGVRFPENRVFEDTWTIPLLLVRACAIRVVTCGWYGYNDNPAGITLTAGGRQLTDLLEGNMNAVDVMGVCDIRHYVSMVNIQIDVYRMTGRVMLSDMKYKLCGDKRTLSWTDRVKLLLPLRVVCVLHKIVKQVLGFRFYAATPRMRFYASLCERREIIPNSRHHRIIPPRGDLGRTPLITFIVPTYNVPSWMLRECIDSILAQPLAPEEREIIVVDDGSDEPVGAMDGVTLIRQQNGGLSAARNAALEVAKGEWVEFVDSDDKLLPAWGEMRAFLSDGSLDVIRMGVERDTDELRLLTTSVHLCEENMQAAAWRYIIRRAALGDLRFTPGILHEDEEFTPLMLARAKNMLVVGRQCYYYRQRSGSIMHSPSAEHIAKRLDDFEQTILRLQGKRMSALSRRIAQLTMDYVYNSLTLERSLPKLRVRIARLRQHGLWPLPDIKATMKYRLAKMLSAIF